MEAIAEVVKREPTPDGPARATLRRMYIPGSGTDDDLTVFYEAEDFDSAIGVTDKDKPEGEMRGPSTVDK